MPPEQSHGLTAAIEALAFDEVLYEVVTAEMGTTDVESAELRPNGLSFRTKDTTRLHRIGLTEKLDEDRNTFDIACPAKAWFFVLEMGLLQIALKGAVRLRCIVAKGETDD